MIDYSMLQEFITEAGEHLEEMETDLLQLEVDPGNREVLNDIFREVHSVKGAAEYVGLRKISELSHKLENLLEILRQGKLEMSNKIVDTLIDARDRLALLNKDLEVFKEEKSEIGDILKRIDRFSADEGDDAETDAGGKDSEPESLENVMSYDLEPDGFDLEENPGIENVAKKDPQPEPPPAKEKDAPGKGKDAPGKKPEEPVAKSFEDELENYEEEYDSELFEIFLQQLSDNVSQINQKAAKLEREKRPNALLEEILKNIDGLRSSANYMGYDRLVEIYSAWEKEVENAKESILEGERPSFKFMTANLEKIAARFPQLKIEIGVAPVSGEDSPGKSEGGARTEDAREGGEPDDFLEAVTKELGLMGEWDSDDIEPAAKEVETEPETSSGGKGETPRDSVEEFESLSVFDDFSESEEESSVYAEKAMDEGGGSKDKTSGFDEDDDRDAQSVFYEPEDEPKCSPLADPMQVEQVDLDDLELLLDDRKLYNKLDQAFDSALENLVEPVKKGSVEDELFSIPEAGPVEFDFGEPSDAEFVSDDADDERTPVAGDPAAEAVEDERLGEESFEEEDGGSAKSVSWSDESGLEEKSEDTAMDFFGEGPEVSAETDPDIVPQDILDRRKNEVFGDRVVKQTLRVDSRKIDALMNQVGELVVSRAWFSQLFNEMREFQQYLKESRLMDKREMKHVRGLTFRLSEATVNLGRVANELQESIMKVRMLPISYLFNRYPRLVRDLVKDSDKDVRLQVKGDDTELDKMMIEEISDPLVHIIRNAVDHGIETVEERRAANKPETGTVTLEAYHESNHVVIEVKDDGIGIDPAVIAAKALERGFIKKTDLELMTRKEIIGLITKPGFSTRTRVTHTSGRGVGMDVVKKNVEKLNGTLEIDSIPGKQSQFRIKIPLTLAIIPALLVRVGADLFTIPLANVEETLRIFVRDTTTIEGVEVVHLRESTLPLVRLTEVFGSRSGSGDESKAFVVVVSTGMRRVGLVVDSLIGQEEVVIKPLVDYLQESSGFSGATILGDGRISLILDVYELVNLTIDRRTRKLAAVSYRKDQSNEGAEERSPHTLVDAR